MLRRIGLVTVPVIVVLLTSGVSAAAGGPASARMVKHLLEGIGQDGRPDCYVQISGKCVIELSDMFSVGGSEGTDGTDGGSTGTTVPGSSSVTSVVVPDRCLYRRVEPRPADDDPAWGGHDPATGDLWTMLCPDSLKVAEWDHTGQNSVVEMNEGTPYFVSEGTSPDEGAAGIDPAVLIARARAAVQMPLPDPAFGPSAGELAVKVPVWFSVPAYEPQVSTATAGRFTAVVTAELMQTAWLPGEPENPNDSSARMVQPVVCDGPGQPFTAGMNPGAPPCGYTYIWQSLKERTDGLGRWVLHVTSRYQVSFEVTNTDTGEEVRSGSEDVETTARVLMPIREWRGMLGDPSGPEPGNQQLYPETLPAAGIAAN